MSHLTFSGPLLRPQRPRQPPEGPGTSGRGQGNAHGARRSCLLRALRDVREGVAADQAEKKMWDTKTLSAPERKHLIIFSGLCHWRWQ